MPLVEETKTLDMEGESLTILPGNSKKRGLYIIDSVFGKDAFTYDTKSTSSYWVLDGEGKFNINGQIVKVKKGDIVKIPPNTVFHYKGQMKLIQKIQPNYDKDNVVEVKKVQYTEKPNYNYIPADLSDYNADNEMC